MHGMLVIIDEAEYNLIKWVCECRPQADQEDIQPTNR